MRYSPVILWICVALYQLNAAESITDKPVKRGRNESTAHIPASNVVGNGNISVFGGIGGAVSTEALHGDAAGGAKIGIGGIMQLDGIVSAINYQDLGPAEAHLQVTLPGNDKLRFFGLAVRGDLYLSTSVDTVSFSADSSRPLFNPYLLPSVIMDLDWLAKKETFPLKTYLMASMVDDPQYLYRYNQLSVKIGAEWKTYRHSIFADAGVSLYKEKRNKLNPAGDNAYEQFYLWIEPGGRYRLGTRISLLGSLGISFYQNLKKNSALHPRIVSLTVGAEMPLIFKETNTEAIRTLVFMEQKERDEVDTFAKSVQSGKGVTEGLELMMDEIEKGDQGFDFSKEKEDLAKKRVEIQKKMQDLEELLKDLEGME